MSHFNIAVGAISWSILNFWVYDIWLNTTKNEELYAFYSCHLYFENQSIANKQWTYLCIMMYKAWYLQGMLVLVQVINAREKLNNSKWSLSKFNLISYIRPAFLTDIKPCIRSIVKLTFIKIWVLHTVFLKQIISYFLNYLTIIL
jgi:hypothetical protein